MNILWVENHAEFARMALREFLTGHRVTIVPSLVEARAALAQGSFEAILLDFDLDDGTGDVLAEVLSSQGARPWLIAASAHEAGNRALLEAGVDAVCSKLEFARIAEVLDRLRQKPRNAGEQR